MLRETYLPMLVAVLGVISLVYLNLRPLQTDEVTALLFLPTTSTEEIISALISSGLEVRNIQLMGRLVEIDISRIDEYKRHLIARELTIFSVQISIRPTILCILPENLKDAR